MSAIQFLHLCKRVGLTMDDLDNMTFEMSMDYIDEWIDRNTTNNEGVSETSSIRMATQADIDAH